MQVWKNATLGLVPLTLMGCLDTLGSSAFNADFDRSAATYTSIADTNRPQFISITIDDGITPTAYDYVQQVLGAGITNPNGKSIPFTFYQSNGYSDYWLVKKLHSRGNEIACHTMTHTTSTGTDYDTWVAEINGCRQTTSQYAGIDTSKIKGFRAPFLQHNSDMFDVLKAQNFNYESSVGENLGSVSSPDKKNWLHSYDMAAYNKQTASTGTLPTHAVSGLWEIPMASWYDASGSEVANMDPPGSYAELRALFDSAFVNRYNGNRAHWGLYLHSSWFADSNHVKALKDFLAMARQKSDAWVVTSTQLIAWEKNPVAKSQLSSQSYMADATYTPDSTGLKFCQFAEGNFHTTQACPASYPKPIVDTTFILTSRVQGDSTGRVNCTQTAWNSTATYNQNDKVSYKDTSYTAQWWIGAGTVPGADAYNGWKKDSLCGYTTYQNNGSISPAGDVHVKKGASQSYTITANSGYKIKDLVVGGVSKGALASFSYSNVSKKDTLVAQFAPAWDTVTVSASTGGAVSPTGKVVVRRNANQTLVNTPASGYSLTGIKIDGAAKSMSSSYFNGATNWTMGNVVGNHTYAATFTRNDTISVTVTGTGSVSPASAKFFVPRGFASQSITATPGNGKTIVSIVLTVGTTNTTLYSNLSGAKTFTVPAQTANSTLKITFSP